VLTVEPLSKYATLISPDSVVDALVLIIFSPAATTLIAENKF